MRSLLLIVAALLVTTALLASAVFAWTPLAVASDPLVRMPGTQPNQVALEAPDRCLNCHAGYNTQVEPGFNWKGSMMAQSARDFLFWACMTVAAQDSVHALGRPNAVDLCERCHFPKGWLEGRSDPTNASVMTGADYDGVQCDVCHRMYNPYYESTNSGTREGNDWLGYWDETNLSSSPSQSMAATTYQEDVTQSQTVKLFNGDLFFQNNLPFSSTYLENGAGQYFVSGGAQKRASFADAKPKHQMLYSRYHKSKYLCGTCHDVSNPALDNLSQNGTPPNDGTTILNSEKDSAYSYFHVERTFSEFMLSDYGQQGGSDGIGPFAPGAFTTSLTGDKIARCQDCHMRDVVGAGCNKAGVPVRPTDSIEHPKSGQPLHDMTGGNAWVSWVLASTVVGSANYDATNASLLNQGPAALTLDLTQGLTVDAAAMLAGVERAKQQLLLAAAVQNLQYDSATGALSFRIQNQTGHKLISGFPEGRRMFVNIKAYKNGDLIYEVNPYDSSVGTLKGLDTSYSPNSPALGPGEGYLDDLVYEMHPTSAVTGETETFHFALAIGRYKDNRIPPKGFRISGAAARLVAPVHDGVDAPDYYSADEYAGGYDDVSLNIPTGADSVDVRLYYQTTSREYIEFLRDEINGTQNLTLPQTAYIAQTDPFFSKLKPWGDVIWQLWDHNKDVPCAAPFMMAEATINVPVCSPPVPTLQYLTPGDGTVELTWSDEHTADPNVTGYKVYLDQGGKAQLIGQAGLTTTLTVTGLTVGQLYCFKVTSLYAGCESTYSNVLCAVPAVPVSLGEAKALPDNSWVYVDDAVVTAGTGLGWGSAFAESPSRASGVKLLTTTEDLAVGQKARFSGLISKVDGEWQISSLNLLGTSQAEPLKPLGIPNKSVANDPSLELTYSGLPTVGLLVKTWGTVVGTIPAGSVMYVDDGSGSWDAIGTYQGLRVQLPAGVALPSAGDRVSITGISRVEKHVLSDWQLVDGQSYAPGTIVYCPSIWVREAADIAVMP